MSVELLVNVTPRETRVAVVENGVPQELVIERPTHRGLVGNIYKGRVSRVLPGMQAAFIDIGLERTAFLHASDIGERGTGDEEPSITEVLHDGDELMVQVVKDPIGSKGARLTTHIAIPSCHLVFLPGAHSIGVSQRIEDDSERQRLRQLVRGFASAGTGPDGAAGAPPSTVVPASDGAAGPAQDLPPLADGYIVRTAAESIRESLLLTDMTFLQRIWRSVRESAAHGRAPRQIHEDLPLVIRTLREPSTTEVQRERSSPRATGARLRDVPTRFLPELERRIEVYDGDTPIFDRYGVEDEIQRALGRRVPLKSGGHLVFDQTEAMTTVDVNTGAYVGHRNLEETIFKTNLEAAQAIARQLRLRNLGGIIIIDFIDMIDPDHRRHVLRALERHLERDPVRSQVSEVTSLGLVQMTRKRSRESLERVLCEPCPTCNGRGTLKTADTVCYEIFREIIRESRQFAAEKLLVLACQEVIDTLIDEESAGFAQLEEFIGKPIRLQVEPMYSREQYDVVLV